MTFVDGLPRPEPLRQIPPLHTRPEPIEHPVDHPKVITPPAPTGTARRQERLQSVPLCVRQIPTPHTDSLTPTPHSGQEIRETVPRAARSEGRHLRRSRWRPFVMLRSPPRGRSVQGGFSLISREHSSTGAAKPVRLPDGSHALRLENLDTSSGPTCASGSPTDRLKRGGPAGECSTTGSR